MSKKNLFINTLVYSVLSASLVVAASDAPSESHGKPASEKCYGIVKKGMNDCAGNSHQCQSQATKEGDPNEFIYVLEGTCQKIVGGTKKE